MLLQLKDRLGRSWRDVARHLDIRECEIDAVQSKYPFDLKEQSYEVRSCTYIHGESLEMLQAISETERDEILIFQRLFGIEAGIM